MSKALTYGERKAKYRAHVEEFLKDFIEGPQGGSVSVADVKRLLHGSSASALTLPILMELKKEGKIELTMQGIDGVIYIKSSS